MSRIARPVGTVAAATLLAATLAISACGGSDERAGSGRASTSSSSRPVTKPTKPPEPIIRSAPLLSTYETGARTVSRDGGISVALPNGNTLWLFGDTGVFERAGAGPWQSTTFIDGSTALLATTEPGAVPGGAELHGIPERFIPTPIDVYLPDGSGQRCTPDTAAFAARWPIGVSRFDPAHVIVTYSIVCVTTPGGIPTPQAEGWGYLLYNWQTQSIDHGPDDVFAPSPTGAHYPPARLFVSPHVEQGRITLYSSQCAQVQVVLCARGDVWSTSMPATTAALSDPASYATTPVATDGSGRWQPLSISVGQYAEGLRLVELATIVGDYRIFTAPRPGAPWHLARSGRLPGCPTRTGHCLALEGHPELSTETRTFVSYKNADSGPDGHIVISSLPT